MTFLFHDRDFLIGFSVWVIVFAILHTMVLAAAQANLYLNFWILLISGILIVLTGIGFGYVYMLFMLG